VFAGVVLEVAHHARYRVTGDVHVDGRHEHANLPARGLEIFVFVHFLDYHYFAIGGGQQQVFVREQAPEGRPEELQQREKRDNRNARKNAVKRHVGAIVAAQQQVEGQQHQQRHKQDAAAFFMYLNH
nr:hypothetical protein [Tanacetum cinerariifolium]